jgi:hypothetical protein
MDDKNQKETALGYEIKQIAPCKDRRGFVLAENPKAPSPFMTAQYIQDMQDRREYLLARYYLDEPNAKKDFITRSIEHQYGFDAKRSKIYRYYAAEQKMAYNTYPRENGEPLGMVAFSECAPVEYGRFTAWGYIDYDKPLPEKLIDDYGLRAAPDNPDFRMATRANEPTFVQGYEILRSVLFKDNRGIALAENPNAPDPFVTWQFTEDKKGKRDYYWGNYVSSMDTATRRYEFRIDEYHDINGVSEKDAYKYYSTQRPVDIGTFPKTENGPVRIKNFDNRADVEQGQFKAWGYLVYDAPLTAKDIYDYELRPAPDNFNHVIAKNKRSQTAPKPIAEQLAEAEKLVQRGESPATDKKPKREER